MLHGTVLPFRIFHMFVQHGASLAIGRHVRSAAVFGCAKVGKVEFTFRTLASRLMHKVPLAQTGRGVAVDVYRLHDDTSGVRESQAIR